jgi:hypothetical protein
VAPKIKLQLTWVTKYLCDVEVIWQLSWLKSGYDCELSSITVCKVTIMITNVIEKINNMCITKYYIWLQGSCNRNTFDDIKHQQKVEISYKDNLGWNWYRTFKKYVIGIPIWYGKKGPPMLGLVSMFKAQYYTNVAKNNKLV